ncbi:MAG: hypothetical protein ACYTGC_10485, partial [Planctomycetota bacterium]
ADAGRAAREALARRHALEVKVDRVVGVVAHGIMNRRLELEAVVCRHRRGRVAGRRELRWLDPAAVAALPVSGATRKVLRLAGQSLDS